MNPENKQLGLERLEKLATHLESGNLSQGRFDFQWYHYREDCGTAGCAIGELPSIFPDQWGYVGKRETPFLVAGGEGERMESERVSPLVDAAKFFGLDYAESRHLFLPWGQDPQNFGGRLLQNNAEPKDVAKNIREFIALQTANPPQS